MAYKHREEWATNRDVAKRPKLGKTWCHYCDASFLGEGHKCRVCGKMHSTSNKRRFKK